MNECGICKSKIKFLLYCNGCFQRAKSVAERRGRVEELKLISKAFEGGELFKAYIGKRLLELESKGVN